MRTAHLLCAVALVLLFVGQLSHRRGSVFGSVMRVENRPGATAERLATLPGVLEDVGRG